MNRPIHRVRPAWTRTLPCLTGAMLLTSPSFAGIELDVVASPSPARQGETLDVEITVTNADGFDRTDVTVVMEYPQGVERLWVALFEGNCPSTYCESGEQATFEIPTLPAGQGVTFSMPIRVDPAATNGTIIPFDVEAFDDGGLEAAATTDITVDGTRELELALVETRDPVTADGLLAYTITYGVLESSAGSPGATLHLPIPDDMSFVSASNGGSLAGGQVEWTLGNLNPGASGEREVILQADAGLAAGSILVTGASFQDTATPMNEVRYETATRVQSEIPLELEVSASPDPAIPGETMDVEITVTNTGAFDRTGVQLLMEYPDGLERLWVALFDGNCPSTYCEAQERAIFDVGTLPAGKGLTFSVPVRVAPAIEDGFVITVEAEVTDATGDVRETGTSFAVDATRELELALVETRDPVTADGLLAYTLTFGVLESSPGSPGTTLHLPIPAGMSFVSASNGGSLAGGQVEWTLGNLNPGTSGEREVILQADAGLAPGSIIVTGASLQDSATPMNEVRYETATRVQNEIPLEIEVSASPDPAIPGETMDVEITVTNTGAFDRTGVQLLMEYPDGLERLWVALFDGNCPSTYCEAQERAIFDVGTLPAGKGLTFSVPVRVAPAIEDGFVITVEAEVTDATGDVRETGTSFAVDATRELELALHESDEPVGPGETLTYTLTYGALAGGGGMAAPDLRFRPPPETTVSFISDDGTLNGGIVEWPLAGLNPGAGGARKVRVQVDAGVPPGANLSATAWFADGAAPADEVRFEDKTRIEGPSPLDVECTVLTDSAPAGTELAIDLSITNTTGFDRTDLVLILEYPDGLDRLWNALFAGTCPSTYCESQERAIFDIPLLAAGETMSFPVPPMIATATLNGTVINFDSFATDSTGFQAGDGDAIMVGSDFDSAIGGDIDGNGVVDVNDLLELLLAWGPCPDPDDCLADLDGNGTVDVQDLLELLLSWG